MLFLKIKMYLSTVYVHLNRAFHRTTDTDLEFLSGLAYEAEKVGGWRAGMPELYPPPG